MAGGRGISDRGRFDRDSVVATSRSTGRFLRGANSARTRSGLAAEELLIFLAIGHLGIDASGEIPRVTPCTYLQIAEFLAVPRETVRRKVGRLCDRGFTWCGPGGVAVRDVEVWLRQASALFAPPPETAASGDDRQGASASEPGVAELRHPVK